MGKYYCQICSWQFPHKVDVQLYNNNNPQRLKTQFIYRPGSWLWFWPYMWLFVLCNLTHVLWKGILYLFWAVFIINCTAFFFEVLNLSRAIQLDQWHESLQRSPVITYTWDFSELFFVPVQMNSASQEPHGTIWVELECKKSFERWM